MTKQFKEIIKDLRNQRNLTQEGLAQAADALANVSAVFNNGDLAEQRMLVRILVDYIEIDGKQVHIHWAFI